MSSVVLYHGNCWDGFCAAWISKHFLPRDTVFIPCQYGEAIPEIGPDNDVYILDFSYPKDTLIDLCKRVRNVVVLDHHKTAQEALGKTEDYKALGINNILIVFDMSKSGGRLTWEYCWDKYWNMYARVGVATKHDPWWLVTYTEDRDLWKWELPNSKAVSAALRSYPLDFNVWEDLHKLDPKDLVPDGEAILRSEAAIVDSHVKNATEIELAGHKILAVNATVLFSDIAGQLAKGRPFGAAYFIRGDGVKVWSLRSTEQGVDVSAIAKQFGGGGHKHAAGFQEKTP